MIIAGNTVRKLLLLVIDRDETSALRIGIATIDLLNSFVAQNHGLLKDPRCQAGTVRHPNIL